MDSTYDEDVMENVFFQMLRKDYAEIFMKSTMEGCVVCVPRAGSLPKYMLTLEDILGHILIPNEEMPESHFCTLNGKDVKIMNQVVTVEHEVAHYTSTHILFEETFYTEDLLKYKVLCIEQPLEQSSDKKHVDKCILTLKTLRDCMDLLWIETGNRDAVESIDTCVNNFLLENSGFETWPLQVMKDKVGLLYCKCLQTVLKDPNLKEKTRSDKHVLDNLKLAVESYMHHGIYQKLMKGISVCTSYDDANLNKIIRNLSDFQIRDLDIRAELHETIPKAKTELSRIDGYSTLLGKIGCLKKVLLAVSKHSVHGNIVAADDLLPILVFLIIKGRLANWHAQVSYLKLFRFSVPLFNQNDEASFLITSLEAAIEHIQCGVLLGPSCPEGQDEASSSFVTPLKNTFNIEEMSNFFYQISVGNLKEVKSILAKSKSPGVKYSELNLCHPLCDCKKCLGLISKSLCETTPTVKSCDDRGLYPLHIAAMYNQPMVVDYLLLNQADANVFDCLGLTPMHYAAMRGHQNVLLLLAHMSADINILDNSFNTPLHYCSNNGHEGCVKALVYYSEQVGTKLNINAINVNGDTPLHHASKWGYVGIARTLLENHADVSIQNKHKHTALDLAHNGHMLNLLTSQTGTSPTRFLRLETLSVSFDFSEEKSEVDKNVVQGNRPNSTEEIKKVERLLRAIACGDVNLACFYLNINPAQDVTSSNIQTKCHPLCTCTTCKTNGDSCPIRPVGVDVNTCNSDGLTPLHVATLHGQSDIAKILLNNGALVDVQTRNRLETPLMLACQNQRLHLARVLLLHGCNLDIQDVKGNTALHYACHTTNTGLVDLLVKFEPNLDLKNHRNQTALKIAEEKMSLAVIKVLKGGKSFDLNFT